MPGRERGRFRIGGMKRLRRYHDKLWLMCPPMKWQTNTDGHKSSTETGFFSLHQRLVFPCVWATIIHRTGVLVPPHARLPPWEVMKRGCHKRNLARQLPNDLPVKLPWGGKWEVVAWIMDVYWSIHQGCRPLEEHVHKVKGWCLYLLTLADSKPKEEYYHSLN